MSKHTEKNIRKFCAGLGSGNDYGRVTVIIEQEHEGVPVTEIADALRAIAEDLAAEVKAD